jgi:hypothetical protein
MATYSFPTSAELRRIEQDKLPNLVARRPIFDILPMENVDAHLLMWEQEDNYVGLQQIRGLNGQPGRVKKTGAKRFIMQPGVYGEFNTIDELELTERRQWGTFNQPVSIDDLVMREQDRLLGRRLDRIEVVGWTLLTAGTFSVLGPDGLVYQSDTFALQTASAAVPWATFATATPLKDFRTVQLLSRGHSVNFGAAAKAYMNRVTFNNLVSNTNTNDLAGRRTSGLQSVLNLSEINSVLAGEDLPQIVIFDGGYIDDAGTFQPFIANAKVVIVGARTDGGRIGEYRMTRNANNPGLAPGAYMDVIDRGAEGSGRQIPRTIEVHDGHNGGPVIYFPSAIVILTVS